MSFGLGAFAAALKVDSYFFSEGQIFEFLELLWPPNGSVFGDFFEYFVQTSILLKLAFRLDGSMILDPWSVPKPIKNEYKHAFDNNFKNHYSNIDF